MGVGYLGSACKEANDLFSTLEYSGQKFPRSRDVTMEGRIAFSGSTAGPADPICTDLTAYVKVGSYTLLHKIFIYSHLACYIF